MSSEMMINITETVFNKLEEQVSLEELKNAELLNSAEYLYINELAINLNISNIIDLQSPIFHSNEIYFNNEEIEKFYESEFDDENDKYDVNEIIMSRLKRMQF
ncbi:9848_t:CDS:1 [Funneliformis caledonium]|uniref:9848_t:CDS:1 n=1 Tax=Funneliformis caledonium TaxID=1117310 RepID=A0A9N8YPH4_9GLOM|nr:9848_t:CDS:1 [Funneliformis caledonium]